MVPDGWLSLTLGDLLDFQNGVNTEAANYGHGTKFVNVMDVFGNSFLTKDTIRSSVFVSKQQNDNYALRHGDILFNRTSETFNDIALSSVYLDDAHAIFGGFVIRGRPKDGRLIPEFSRYCFSSDTVRRETIRRGQGVIRANIGQGDLRKVPILLPPLTEQKKIADILSTWDKAIETTGRLLANSESQKRALARQLLTGNLRLKGLTHEPWKVFRMGDLFTERVERGGEDLPLLSITATRGVIPQSDVERRNISREDKSSYKRIARGDIGYNTMRMWQGVSALSRLDGLVSPAYTILRTKKLISPEFAAHLFKLPSQVQQFRRYSQGLTSDQWNLKFKHFREVPAYIPTSRREQDAIALAISDAISLCSGYRVEAEKLRYEKRALMQELLTGKRRVFP